MSEAELIAARKRDHIDRAIANSDVGSAGWSDVHLVPRALPEIDDEQIAASVSFLGRELAAPLLIAGMTGGHPDAEQINRRLAVAAAEHGIGMGLGSQRTALVDPGLTGTYAVARRHAPDAFIVANIGVSQLADQPGRPALNAEQLAGVVDMVGADALAVHLNIIEEQIQVEGDRRTSGLLAGVAQAIDSLDVPVIVKETGGGLDGRTARDLAGVGAAALDVGGSGGTSFAAIEADRAEQLGDDRQARLGRAFARWGIPTAAAVLECRHAGLPIVATGGVRTGLDVAKAVSLGATLAGAARPFLLAANESEEAIVEAVGQWIRELRLAMLLAGAAIPEELRGRSVVTGAVRAWEQQRRRSWNS